jgi:hypothetical protein
MHPTTHPLWQEREPAGSGTPPPPVCPLCAGRLVPLRDHYRCARCLYSACPGCEPGPLSPAGAD